MTDQHNDTHDPMATDTHDLPPIVPPVLLLALSGLSFLLALAVLFVSPGFGVLGWGALVTGVLLLVLLVVLAPQQTVDFLTGRSFRFGSTSILFTLAFIAVLMVVYWFITTLDLRADLTQTDQFSLNTQAAETITLFASDPSIPPIEIIGFYNNEQISVQEQITPLLQDYVQASDGKITYRFVNPDQQIQLANRYEATSGSLVIVNTTIEDPTAAEVLTPQQTSDQNQITNAIIEVVASGDFNVYFLEVDNGVDLQGQGDTGAALFVQELGRYNWNFEAITITQATATESDITLNDPNADGEVLVIPGGSRTLSDDEVTFISDYLNNGGNAIITAQPDGDDPALASTEALNAYLSENFGLSFDSDVVLDPANARGGRINLIDVTNIDRTLLVTEYIPRNFSLLLNAARRINIADETPPNVQTYSLAQTESSAYIKSLDDLLAQDAAQDDDDPTGPFTVLAAAENTETGAKLVLSGGEGLFLNAFLFGQGVGNFETAFGALAWAMDYDQFEQGTQLLLPDFDIRPEDVPVQATAQQLSNIRFISLFGLPLGVLLAGGVVWYLRRE